MGKTKRNFLSKTKTPLVKKAGKSKWKRKQIAEKREEKIKEEQKVSHQMFKIAKENGSRLVSEGKSNNDKNKVSPNIMCLPIILSLEHSESKEMMTINIFVVF